MNLGAWRKAMSRIGFEMHPAAVAFLQEFGGLRVSISGAGVRTARLPFWIDPNLCYGMEDWIRGFESSQMHGLFPVGEAGAGGEGTLVISEGGEVYLLCQDGEGELATNLGVGFDALACLVVGDFISEWRPDDVP